MLYCHAASMLLHCVMLRGYIFLQSTCWTAHACIMLDSSLSHELSAFVALGRTTSMHNYRCWLGIAIELLIWHACFISEVFLCGDVLLCYTRNIVAVAFALWLLMGISPKTTTNTTAMLGYECLYDWRVSIAAAMRCEKRARDDERVSFVCSNSNDWSLVGVRVVVAVSFNNCRL